MMAVRTTLGSWRGELNTGLEILGASTKLKLVLLIVLSTLVIIACTSDDPVANGEIKLEFKSASPTGIALNIQNGSPQPIQFRGLRSSPTAMEFWPDDVAIECKLPSDSTSTEEPFSISDGSLQPEIISLPPSERMQLLVLKSMPLTAKEAICKVKLRLVSGLTVESAEFRP